MTQSTHALSPFVVEEFCKLCDWTHEVWLNHRALFDDNPRSDELMKSFAGHELERLSIISHEYSLLQIVKLHDRAIMGGNATLGIEYVLVFGGWPNSVRDELENMAKKLRDFAVPLRDVRNKVLSHNDLASIVAGATLGSFEEDAEVQYFKILKEFVNVVHKEVIGSPWPFNEFVKSDVAAFLDLIKPA
ncbi:MAG TPA: hypothetical protein VHZ52_17665 [Acidobacteriaceae bacterium]|jgi:hypothetical protein|nr:hypothetical protein [Acidobacteriaceae bacterium]